MPDNEVLRIISPELAEDEKKAEPEVVFERGDGVKVIEGYFLNFDGVVDEVYPDKARLKVFVSIFGRDTLVDLEYSQVQKLN